MENRTKLILTLLAVLVIAAFIFFFSSQQGDESSRISGKVTEAILSLFVPDYGRLSAAERAPYIKRWEVVVRKAAHFSEYALLAVALAVHMHYRVKPNRLWAIALLACGIAAAYACTDELHQRFVSERMGALADVGIDSVGALTGALLAMLCLKLRERKKREACAD